MRLERRVVVTALAAGITIGTQAACSKTTNTTSATADLSVSAGTVPSPTPTAIYIGPATLVRGTRPYSGQVVDAFTFVDCYHNSIRLKTSDSVTPGGSCSNGYDIEIRRAAGTAVARQGGGGDVLINGVSIQGDTAIATYVRGSDAGQVLLTRSAAGWTANSVASGGLTTSSVASAGVSAAKVVKLQRSLPFDVTATPLPKMPR